MRAIVLSAGLGTRFRPATDSRPKALLPHLNVPLIDRRLAALRRAGILEVAVNLHHEGRQIVEHLGESGAEGAAVAYFWEPEILGTAGALRNAGRFLDEDDFLVWNVDAELQPDIGLLEQVHRAGGASATLLTAPNPDPTRFTPLFAQEGRLIGIGGDGPSPLVFTGVSIHAPGLLPRIGAGFRSLVDDLWRPMLERDESIRVAIHSGAFFDLGTPEDLLRASKGALETREDFEPREGFFDRNDQVLDLEPARAEGLRRSVLGRVRLSPGARIDGCVLWDGAEIGRNVVATGCLVGPVRLADGCEYRDAFLWPGREGEIREIPLHSQPRSPAVK